METALKREYKAKLLLFGEYTVLQNGVALAVPLEKYYGQWKTDYGDQQLDSFFAFLNKLDFIDTARLKSYMHKALRFDSNIPQGYGLGSSAALTAAAYKLFGLSGLDQSADSLLKRLGLMENHFHGQSSGFDPLCSYLDRPVLKKEGEIYVLEDFVLPQNLFLLDSCRKRDSEKMIAVFKRKTGDAVFNSILKELDSTNRSAIQNLQKGHKEHFLNDFRRISEIQFKNFEEMIPSHIANIWSKGLKGNDSYLKLSGAGGGGYFMGIGRYANNKNISYLS